MDNGGEGGAASSAAKLDDFFEEVHGNQFRFYGHVMSVRRAIGRVNAGDVRALWEAGFRLGAPVKATRFGAHGSRTRWSRRTLQGWLAELAGTWEVNLGPRNSSKRLAAVISPMRVSIVENTRPTPRLLAGW